MTSQQHLLESIKKHIDKAEIVSFDIFDTLLVRPYVKPTDLFLHMEKHFGCEGFAKERPNAERRARANHQGLEDITLDMIYEEIDDKFKEMKQKEMDWEEMVLQANPELKQVYDYAKKQGKKVIITSDMYLSEKFLGRVLENKGYKNFDKLYVSSEYKKTKWTGNLYKQLVDDFMVQPSDILHIGDNRQSDYEKAKEQGIVSVHIAKIIDKLFETNLRAKVFYEKHLNDLDASVLLGLVAMAGFNKDFNYWQNFGFVYGGPTILAYMLWLDKQVKKDNISDVFFVARDGYTLQKVYDIIKTTKTKSHYFYGPRVLNVVCNMDYKNDEGFNTSVAPAVLLKHFRGKLSQIPNIDDTASCIEYLKENFSTIKELCETKKSEYEKYIASFNSGVSPALVDSCTLKFSGQKVLETGLNKKVQGYYWIVLTYSDSGVMYSAYQPEKNHTLLNWNLMELFMTAPNPPVEDVCDGKPVFKQANMWEQKRIEIYPDLSQGMVSFAHIYIDMFKKIGFYIDYKVIVDWLNVLCSISTDEDKKQFENIKHAGTMDHNEYESLMQCWNETKNIDKSYVVPKTVRINLLGIPLLKCMTRANSFKIKLFNQITIYKQINEKNTKSIKLLGFIPIFTIKTKINGSATLYRPFGLFTLIKVKRGNK